MTCNYIHVCLYDHRIYKYINNHTMLLFFCDMRVTFKLVLYIYDRYFLETTRNIFQLMQCNTILYQPDEILIDDASFV